MDTRQSSRPRSWTVTDSARTAKKDEAKKITEMYKGKMETARKELKAVFKQPTSSTTNAQ
jgi:hypothetical protein